MKDLCLVKCYIENTQLLLIIGFRKGQVKRISDERLVELIIQLAVYAETIFVPKFYRSLLTCRYTRDDYNLPHFHKVFRFVYVFCDSLLLCKQTVVTNNNVTCIICLAGFIAELFCHMLLYVFCLSFQ